MKIEEVSFSNNETVFRFLQEECGHDPADVEISMSGLAEITVKVQFNLGDKTEVQTILVETGDTFQEACMLARSALNRYHSKMFIDCFIKDLASDVKLEYYSCFTQRGSFAFGVTVTDSDHLLERIDNLIKGLNNLRHCALDQRHEIESKKPEL